jgi:hypothetical protein
MGTTVGVAGAGAGVGVSVGGALAVGAAVGVGEVVGVEGTVVVGLAPVQAPRASERSAIKARVGNMRGRPNLSPFFSHRFK